MNNLEERLINLLDNAKSDYYDVDWYQKNEFVGKLVSLFQDRDSYHLAFVHLVCPKCGSKCEKVDDDGYYEKVVCPVHGSLCKDCGYPVKDNGNHTVCTNCGGWACK